MTTPVPTLCRLEYLTRNGWVVGHAGINLLNPSRYCERLTERGKFGRATELDDRLQPTGQVWTSAGLPDDPSTLPADILEKLHPDPPYRIPKVGGEACPLCDEVHPKPFDGSCLL